MTTLEYSIDSSHQLPVLILKNGSKVNAGHIAKVFGCCSVHTKSIAVVGDAKDLQDALKNEPFDRTTAFRIMYNEEANHQLQQKLDAQDSELTHKHTTFSITYDDEEEKDHFLQELDLQDSEPTHKLDVNNNNRENLFVEKSDSDEFQFPHRSNNTANEEADRQKASDPDVIYISDDENADEDEMWNEDFNEDYD